MSAFELTPKRIVSELDKYIVGQGEAKRAVAIALRNRWRRQNVRADLRDEIAPKNIIMIGPTGVGKTEIARRLARLADCFHLNAFEVDCLLLCLAPELDPRYERLYAYLQDDVTRKQASVNLILDLLAEPGLDRLRLLTHFMSTAPLMKYHLLERDEPAEGENWHLRDMKRTAFGEALMRALKGKD